MAKGICKLPEEFEEEVYQLVGDEYTVMTPYRHSKEKVIMRHNICGHEYPVLPNAFTSTGRRCPKCADTTKSHEQYLKEVYELVGDEYTILGKYVNNHTGILTRHNICGHEYFTPPKSLVNLKRKCPKCSKENNIDNLFKKRGENNE